MILLVVLAGSASIVLQTLSPRYVQSSLGVDPADSVYVFGPAALGLVVVLASAPTLIRKFGERAPAIAGFLFVTLALLLMGLVGPVTDVINPINPLRALDLLRVNLGERLRTAALLALPLGYGLALSKISVQTYINRRVPIAYQSRAFALQNALKHGFTIVPLAVLGAAATAFGVEVVLIASPFLLFALACGLVYLSFHVAGQTPASGLDVVSTFWQEEDEDIEPPV